MQLTVTITIAKNGYFVRYLIPQPQNKQNLPANVAGPIERIPFGLPDMKEESLVITDEQELITLLKNLKEQYYNN